MGLTITTTGALYDADAHTVTLQMSQDDFLALLKFGIRVGGQSVTFTASAPTDKGFVQSADGTWIPWSVAQRSVDDGQ